MSRVRLLVLDIDGTLLASEKKISPRTRAAILAARERGVRLVLATGRRYPSTRPVAEDLGGFIPLVLHNGALVIEAGRCCAAGPSRGSSRRRRWPWPVRTVSTRWCTAGSGARGSSSWRTDPRGRPRRPLPRALAHHVREVEDAAALDEDPMQVMLGGPPRPWTTCARPWSSS